MLSHVLFSPQGVAAVSVRVAAVPRVIQVEGAHSLARVLSDQPSEVDGPTGSLI